jgi:hypothetical protein
MISSILQVILMLAGTLCIGAVQYRTHPTVLFVLVSLLTANIVLYRIAVAPVWQADTLQTLYWTYCCLVGTVSGRVSRPVWVLCYSVVALMCWFDSVRAIGSIYGPFGTTIMPMCMGAVFLLCTRKITMHLSAV